MRDSISVLVANTDEQRNGSSGFYLPRYKNQGPLSTNGSAIDMTNFDMNDNFDLGEIPIHLMKEYRATYSSQISIEKFLILKVKETEKENRLLRNQLSHAKSDLKFYQPPDDKSRSQKRDRSRIRNRDKALTDKDGSH